MPHDELELGKTAQEVSYPKEKRIAAGLELVGIYIKRRSYGDYCGLKIIADGEYYLDSVRAAAKKGIEQVEFGFADEAIKKGDYEGLVNLSNNGSTRKVKEYAKTWMEPIAMAAAADAVKKKDAKAVEKIASNPHLPKNVTNYAKSELDKLEMKAKHGEFVGCMQKKENNAKKTAPAQIAKNVL